MGQGHLDPARFAARDEARLHQDLRAVADAEEGLAPRGLVGQDLDDGVLGGDGPRADAVLVGEAAGEDVAVVAAYLVGREVEADDLGSSARGLQRPGRLELAVHARELDYGYLGFATRIHFSISLPPNVFLLSLIHI